ncbi:MAG: ABC-2 family transporter protein [candidate division WS6 bacterium OLB20]|uniref:ABC-2 family transporter protein n=1 Tax=candidate division WS6 bacterium OLB20 TaxID=1617426 RepID=A0A136LXW5_9BACT|nr:MAG: ABC-2 family transporter protein [candidate division WS6 bacterium OLB20]
MNRMLVVAKFEYLKTVKRKAFWFATLFMPVMIVVIMAVSAFSSVEGSKRLEQVSESIDHITVIDEAGLISESLFSDPVFKGDSFEQARQQVQSGETDAVVFFPEDTLTSGSYQVVTKDVGLFQTFGYQGFAEALIQQSAYERIDDPTAIAMITQPLSSQVTVFGENGQTQPFGVERFIVPGVSLLFFFLSVFISGQYMLQSVAEEKENRMIENLLSMVSSRSLIFGKLLGLTGAAFTQLIVWAVLGGGAVIFGIANESIDVAIDFSQAPLETIPVNIIFTLLGFLFFASVMTGVGGIGTSYKDSQSLSSVFVILSVLPFYFITILLSDPNGVIAQVVSYFPFTSAMIFILRNSITTLSPLEVGFGLLINLVYVALAGLLALKLFNLGSLMYNRRPKMREIMHVLLKRG